MVIPALIAGYAQQSEPKIHGLQLGEALSSPFVIIDHRGFVGKVDKSAYFSKLDLRAHNQILISQLQIVLDRQPLPSRVVYGFDPRSGNSADRPGRSEPHAAH